METVITELELQRLVDGRLESEEREALLSLAKRQPEAWQRLALAFLEEQTLTQTLAGDEAAYVRRPPANARRVLTALLALSCILLIVFYVGRQSGYSAGLAVHVEQEQDSSPPQPPSEPEEEPLTATLGPMVQRGPNSEANQDDVANRLAALEEQVAELKKQLEQHTHD